MRDSIKKNKYKIIFCIILIVAIFVRTYKLSEIPHGIHVDEAGMAYDAFCISNYGTDRYLNPFPLYLVNFGGGQSVLYLYLASILIKIFGLNLYTIRLPAVILGIIVIIIGYFIVKKESNEKNGLIFMTLITICPWHIMASRWGLDCNLFAPMSVISIYFLLKSKNIKDYIISGIFFGLTLYTYVLSYIIIPIFLMLTIIFMLYTKKIKLKEILIMLFTIILLAAPLILMILVNNEVIPEIKTFITIPKLFNYRSNEIDFSLIFENLKFIFVLFTNDQLVYNALPEFGTIYIFSIPFVILGFFIEIYKLIKNIKEKKFGMSSIMLFLVISVFVCMLIIKEPNINKANAIFIPILFLAYNALVFLYQNNKRIFHIIFTIYLLSFILFSYFYFNIYPKKYETQPYFDYELMEAINLIKNNKILNNRNVYIYTYSQQPYIYTLINNNISPFEFNKSLHKNYDNNFSYSNYFFNQVSEINANAVYIVDNDYTIVKNILKQYNFNFKILKQYTIAFIE